MAEISEALTRRVAELARLRLSQAEVTQFTGQLQQILSYVDQIQAVDVTDVEPLIYPNASREAADSSREPAFRADRVVEPRNAADGSPKVLEAAPEIHEGAFQVPQIV